MSIEELALAPSALAAVVGSTRFLLERGRERAISRYHEENSLAQVRDMLLHAWGYPGPGRDCLDSAAAPVAGQQRPSDQPPQATARQRRPKRR